MAYRVVSADEFEKIKNGVNGGSGGLPTLAPTGTGGNTAPKTESVVNGVANGEWMNPNTSYIKSGAYLDNQNISDRGKGAMAAMNRQGFNFDSVPSNISEYSGIDANASDQDKLMSYMYNNMRNMSPEQQGEVAQGVQDLYSAAGRNDDVVAAYNNAVFGDGTGTNGLAAQEAQRNATAGQGEYQLSNSAQRAEATSERDQLQAQINEYKNGDIYNAIKSKPENRYKSDEEIALLVQEEFDDEIRKNPNGDLARTVAKIKELDSTIGSLSSAINEEVAAGEKESADYRRDYINDKYMQSAVDFVKENPSLARRIAMDYAEQKLGMPREDAARYATTIVTNNNGGAGNVVNPELELLTNQPELALAIASNIGGYSQYDSLMSEYARQRQDVAEDYRRQQMTGNRFNESNYSPYGNNNVFTYQPKF